MLKCCAIASCGMLPGSSCIIVRSFLYTGPVQAPQPSCMPLCARMAMSAVCCRCLPQLSNARLHMTPASIGMFWCRCHCMYNSSSAAASGSYGVHTWHHCGPQVSLAVLCSGAVGPRAGSRARYRSPAGRLHPHRCHLRMPICTTLHAVVHSDVHCPWGICAAKAHALVPLPST